MASDGPEVSEQRESPASRRGPEPRLFELPPSTAVTLVEAAALAGVSVRELEQRCEEGALLFETARRGGRDERIVRIVDLCDLFEDPSDEPERGAPATIDVGPSRAPAQAVPGSQAASSAQAEPSHEPSREAAPPPQPTPAAQTALSPLVGELRARLDEAERERRASTAGLLLAQRRLLALETAARPIGWHQRTGVWTGALAFAALGALWFDLSGRLGAVQAATDSDAEQRAGVEQRLGGELVALGERLGNLAAESATAREDAAATRRFSESRAAEEATMRRAAVEHMEREREMFSARLEDLRRESERAQAVLQTERDAAARERARFVERLDGTERDLERTRVAVQSERRAADEDRAAFLEQLAALERAATARESVAAATLVQLNAELVALRAATREAQLAAEHLAASRVATSPGGDMPASESDSGKPAQSTSAPAAEPRRPAPGDPAPAGSRPITPHARPTPAPVEVINPPASLAPLERAVSDWLRAVFRRKRVE